MFLKTSTGAAPWHLVEGNDKLWVRVRTLEILIEALRRGLGSLPGRERRDED